MEGTRVPVTRISVGPCVVTQIKVKEKDGYDAIQLGFFSKKAKNVPKPLQGHLKKALQNSKSYKASEVLPRYLREVRLNRKLDIKVGDEVTPDQVLKKGDVIQVTGISKGKGFAGVVKRHGFAGGPKTHGQSDRHRAPGSIGQRTTPGRVFKGKRMAGRMGGESVTVKNLMVVDFDRERNEILVSGSVPGARNTLLMIKKVRVGSLEDLVEEAPVVVEQEDAGSEDDKKSEEK